jgi:hypothetical protein
LISCDVGFADCDGNPTNGCETDLKSPTSCGACGVACTAIQICTPSGCAGSCAAPLTYCNGSCVDYQSSVDHCGGCATACSDPPIHGVAVCSGGTCGISCDAGYTPINGKCADISSDPTCCGPTCAACPAPYGGDGVCVAGACALACETGWTICNGVCVDPQRDVANCGGCGATCAGICTGGVCDPTAKQILAVGNNPSWVAADGTSVFWVDGASSIMQIDRDGLTAPITLASAQQSPSWVAVDATSVYWTNGTGGGVWKTSKGVPGATFLANAVSPTRVVVNSTNAYFDSQGGIYSVPKNGGTPTEVFIPVMASGAFDVDDSNLWHIGPDPGPGIHALSIVVSGLDGSNGVAALGLKPASNPATLSFALGAGMAFCSNNQDVVPCGVMAPNIYMPHGGALLSTATPVAVDATYGYATLTGMAWGWSIDDPGLFRMALCGGPVELLGTGLGNWNTASDDLWLYWTDAAGVHRTAK